METREFQAEVKQILDIVVHSLYTDKEIFIRELVSNASDAIEKFRHLQLTESTVFDAERALEIKITTDEAAGTFTIEDFGIGMTQEEAIQNLGTIAHSGSKQFLEALKQGGDKNSNLIGQFGVGFYSVFMVADQVEVHTRSWKLEAESVLWKSEGLGTYAIGTSDRTERGSKIILTLKESFKEFAQNFRVKSILEKHSRFVQYPVSLGDEKINTVSALWLQSKKDLTEDDYKSFYKFQAATTEDPLSWLHFNADAPLTINALLFIPETNPERLGWNKIENQVALYCRKVLIDLQPKGLFPEWLRFLRGVVDSADLPLNISRESMQDSGLMQKLNRVVTRRFIKFLDELAGNSHETYIKFWKNFGYFIKEGFITDYSSREDLTKLLRFQSTETVDGQWTTLPEYVSRMQVDQKSIYFLMGKSQSAAQKSPYLEAFRARNIEVIVIHEPIDEALLQNLGKFDEKEIVSIDREDIELSNLDSETDIAGLSAEATESLCSWIKDTLDNKNVTQVTSGERSVSSPLVALNADKFMTSHMRKMLKNMNPETSLDTSVSLQINPKHALIQNLVSLQESNPEIAKLLLAQLFDTALLNADLLEDSQTMIPGYYKLLEALTAAKL